MKRGPHVCVPVEWVDRAISRIGQILEQSRAIMDGYGTASNRAYDVHQSARSIAVELQNMRRRADRNARRRRPR